jgi:putative Mg2+ transporter-C (MgtC) family protein
MGLGRGSGKRFQGKSGKAGRFIEGNRHSGLLCLKAASGGKMAHSLAQNEIFLRVGAAVLAGFALGFEREGHGRAAGLKTMVLACVASCLGMILSELFFLESMDRSGTFLPDRARLAAGILTGIGFLGAGAILRQGNSIRGVTTGAVLWYATILGMACGSGYFLIAGLGVLIALGVLYLLPVLESHVQRDGYARLSIALDLAHDGEEKFLSLLKQNAVKITESNRSVDLQGGERQLEYQLKFQLSREADLSRKVVEKLAGEPGVRRIRWE